MSDLAFVCGGKGHPQQKRALVTPSPKRQKRPAFGNPPTSPENRSNECAEKGASLFELNSIFGWVGSQQAMLYTKAAELKRLALNAPTLDRTPAEQTPPAPSGEVRAAEKQKRRTISRIFF